jgi:hypothetical protein
MPLMVISNAHANPPAPRTRGADQQAKHGHDPLYTGGEFRRLVRTRPALCHRVLHTAERLAVERPAATAART